MGKSQNGAIWLNADMLSPYEFWQYWRNTTDADTGKFLKLFTELPVDECNRLGALEGQEINDAKIILANEVTALCHGSRGPQRRQKLQRATSLKKAAWAVTFRHSPSKAMNFLCPRFSSQQVLLIVMAKRRRLIEDGAAKLNDEKYSDGTGKVSATEIGDGLKLSAGKKRHAIIKLG